MRQKIRLLFKTLDLTTFIVLFFIIFVIFKVSNNEPSQRNILQTLSSKTLENEIKILPELSYNKLQSQKNQIHIMFFGDLIYDRSVYIKLPWEKQLSWHFGYRYNQIVPFHGIQTTFSELSKSFDFVVFNMEWPIWKYYETGANWKLKKIRKCSAPYKSISFCSYSDILPFMRELWFNAVNLANNHVMDWWIPWHLETIRQLKHNQIKYFGYIYGWKKFEENYILTWLKDEIKYAWHGYDYTVYNFLEDKYCNDLKEYKKNWYTNFVAVHRWPEYNPLHSQTQEDIAKFLINCWADLIVWHHPHVIQDSQNYSWVAVIYSLWNFLFDQYFSEPTKVWWYTLIDRKDNKKTSIITWTIDAYAD